METRKVDLGSIELNIGQRPARMELPLIARLAPVFEAMGTAYADEHVTISQMFARMASAIPADDWDPLCVSILSTTQAVVRTGPQPELVDLSGGEFQVDRAFGTNVGLLLRACRAAIEVRLGNFTLEDLLGLESAPEPEESPSTSPPNSQ